MTTLIVVSAFLLAIIAIWINVKCRKEPGFPCFGCALEGPKSSKRYLCASCGYENLFDDAGNPLDKFHDAYAGSDFGTKYCSSNVGITTAKLDSKYCSLGFEQSNNVIFCNKCVYNQTVILNILKNVSLCL